MAAVADTEYDEDGRIVGQGLTLRLTRHHFTVDDRRLYTWCALDTLIFPGVLDKAVTIESVSPTSGTSVRLHVDGTGVSEVEPATAVVSLLIPDDMRSVRSAFCSQVHFFASPEDAQPWLDSHPGGHVMPVDAAYRLGKTMAATMLGRASLRGGPIAPGLLLNESVRRDSGPAGMAGSSRRRRDVAGAAADSVERVPRCHDSESVAATSE